MSHTCIVTHLDGLEDIGLDGYGEVLSGYRWVGRDSNRLDLANKSALAHYLVMMNIHNISW